MSIRPDALFIFITFFSFGVLEAFKHGFMRKPDEKPTDKPVELVSITMLLVAVQPLVLFSSGWLASIAAPQYRDALADLSWWAAVVLLLLCDDMVQYWWHRCCHRVNWLYKLHRPHHNANYMSIRIVYRNNLFYYLLLPNLWLSGILIYLGLGWVYVFYLIFKMLVITAAHSDVPWDEPLYKIKWLSPVMWFVERTISTPSTHSMHHGRYDSDPNTHYKGNYGNLLFFWDILFGTARVTRQRPSAFGIEHLPEPDTGEQILWPLIKSTPSIDESIETRL